MKISLIMTNTADKIRKTVPVTFSSIVLICLLFYSCEGFFDPNQELILDEEVMFKDWIEYRSAGMGIYSLQQELMEQIMVLGELRGDLLKITSNATPELMEVYHFNVGKDNPYASPVKFYELISACNNLIRQLKAAHPNVTDKKQPVNNYDRLYGEVLCMRAWAYFNAVRIYGKVPYIHEALSSAEEIEKYVNSGATYTVEEYIVFAPDGYNNDTIRDTTIVLEKMFLDQKAIIDTFTMQLENEIKAVGVNHSIYNGDLTWQVTIWNNYARHVLLGQMYLFDGNYTKAIDHFNKILYNFDSQTSDIRFGLDGKFEKGKWINIFRSIDPYEHILTSWFGKAYQQTNKFQLMFSLLPPNKYMMKPTASCIGYWENTWNDPKIQMDNVRPERSFMIDPGIPGDFFRGYGVSYKYYKNGVPMSSAEIAAMLTHKKNGNIIDVQLLMNDVDTVVAKYCIGKNPFSHDANFNIYRAAGVHLYAAEIYALWSYYQGGMVRPETNTSLTILNNGKYPGANPIQLGVRGRVGFADGYEAIHINDIIYKHDPFTNEIVGYMNYTGNLAKKQIYLVDKIIEERARELAFEGERFYDLMRVAKRRNDPSFLADKVASKFNGPERDAMRAKLMDPQNWYINYY